MCPACLGSAVMVIAGMVSTGGLTALVMKFRAKKDAKKSVLQNSNPKEETWAK